MARTIQEIRRSISEAFIADSTIQAGYKLAPGKTFEEQFSKVSLEAILFWVFASAIYTLEVLFDEHRKEVKELVAEAEPHTLLWYTRKAKAYLHGKSLLPYSDKYDTSSLSPEEIEKLRVVRYAVASEYNSVVYLKVAGVDDKGKPSVLGDNILAPLRAYMQQIKDAGVPVRVISSPGDELRLTLEVYMQPVLLSPKGKLSEERDKAIRKVVEDNIASLPFDGVFRPSDLVVALSQISGVESSVVSSASSAPAGSDKWLGISGYHRPHSGYYHLDTLNIVYKPYEPFRSL